MAGDPVIPPPLDDDDDDVAWALQTAAVQWNRGARADAVVWLRRAVDAAIASGNSQRTKDLTRLAAQVADSLVAVAMAQPDSAAPPPPPSAPPLPPPPASVPPASEVPGNFDHLLPNPRHSLTGEIPFEVESESDDDFDDQAPTIPPPKETGGERAATHTSGEYSVDGAELLPESFVPGPPGAIVATLAGEASELGTEREEPGTEREEPGTERDGAGHAEPTMLSAEDAPLRETETPTVERDVEALIAEEGPPEPVPATTEDETLSARVRDVAARSVEPTMDVVSPPAAAADRVPPSIEPTLEVPAPSEEKPAPAPSPAGVEGPPIVDGIALDQVRGFEDLPEDAQQKLAASAVMTELGPDEEVLSFAAALVTQGRVGIMPAIADVAAGIAQPGDVVFTRGTLDEGVLLRVVALQAGTRVATWSTESLAAALSDCPWVADELRLVADRFQALAGSVLGPLGDRLDDSLRGLVTPKLDVRAYGPGEIIVTQGKPVPGLHVVGAGRVEIIEGEAITEELTAGEFLFSAEVLAAGKAHATARAGPGGALLLVASRSVAHELLVSVPPLLEILAG